jgi:hypothetical protein
VRPDRPYSLLDSNFIALLFLIHVEVLVDFKFALAHDVEELSVITFSRYDLASLVLLVGQTEMQIAKGTPR